MLLYMPCPGQNDTCEELHALVSGYSSPLLSGRYEVSSRDEVLPLAQQLSCWKLPFAIMVGTTGVDVAV